jgi:hypothetical protein
MSSNHDEGENAQKGDEEKGKDSRFVLSSWSHVRTLPVSFLIPAGIVVLAVLGWIVVAIWGDRERAWGVLLTDFLFLSCLGGGLVVWPAIVVASRGQWMGSTQNIALAGLVLLPACFVMLVVLACGAPAWAPWLQQDVSNSWWLNTPWLFVRDLVSLAIFSGLAVWFTWEMRRGTRPKRLAGWLIFIYTIVYSFLGIDLAMGLDPQWYSLVFGIYFFISGLYIAVAAWAFTTALTDPRATPDQLDDQAKLMITFCLLTTYMMYAQLLTIWYENLPKETRELTPRLNWITNWPAISIVLLFVFYLGPLILFLARRGKRSRPYVIFVAGLVLTSMWLERWWLVMPPLNQPLAFTPAEITGVVALLAGCFLFLYWVRLRMEHR